MRSAAGLLTSRPPDYVHLPPLVRAAASAPEVGRRKETTYLDLPCRTLLNRCDSPGMPFGWSVNPYRGCEIGCRYCYARYTHAYMGLEAGRLFETRIYAKRGAASALERDLSRMRRPAGPIAIGTATDAYQPAERLLGVTRGVLEVFARHEGLRLSLTTKSDLVLRDLDLLGAILRRNEIHVNLTITTLSRRLARILEPRAPRPARRLEAVRRLAQAGVPAGVHIMPVLPGITDALECLEAVIAAAARAGARRVAHQVLRLSPSTKEEFYPFLADRFPRLAPRYRRIYGASASHSSAYREKVRGLVERLKRRHGLGDPEDACEGRAGGGGQLALGF